MARSLVTSRGVPVTLGAELGRGGEGAVYDAPGTAGLVAKVYAKEPDAAKQAKLTFMAATIDDELVRHVAWPRETLHARRGGAVIGFLMPKVGGAAMHTVYSPKHRQRERPTATWDFLLSVARNTAAAFDTLHKRGHLAGDVNHGNVLVGNDSRVVLIDADSFQVKAHGTLHPCEVGVAHFTPPELQGVSSFRGLARTVNHDNFGLALLIFHLLFGGRHPYAGVPLRSGVGEALEADIKAFGYAYARDASARGCAPPPRSIAVSTIPDAMESMFHVAFTEAGATRGRPTAAQWLLAIDAVLCRLRRCGASRMHVYPDHLTKCPWCELESSGVLLFVDLGAAVVWAGSDFVLARAWALIEAVPPPPHLKVPKIEAILVKAAALPPGVPGQVAIGAYRVLAVIVAVAVFVAAPKAWVFSVLGGLLAVGLAGSVGSRERSEERAKRKAAEAAAQAEYERLLAQLRREAGPEGYEERRTSLRRLRDEYEALPKTEQLELNRLHSTAQERQKHAFLDGFFLDSASIAGVGPTRKAALRSFGIETAADCERQRIRQVRGFGESLTSAVMDWRASCERQFRFNPGTAVTEADKQKVRASIGARRIALETQLIGGPSALQLFRQQAPGRAASLGTNVERAAGVLAQARADASLL